MKLTTTLTLIFAFSSSLIYSQNNNHNHNHSNTQGEEMQIGKSIEYIKLIEEKRNSTRSKSFQIPIYLPDGQIIESTVNIDRMEEDGRILIGAGLDQTSNFKLILNPNGKVNGEYSSISQKKAYEYHTENGILSVTEVNVNDKLCIEYEDVNLAGDEFPNGENDGVVEAQPSLQSLPGSPYVVYIDMDGEVSTSRWNGGATIDAQPMGFSQNQMREVWRLVAEDFRPFNVNVTTDRAVYDATPLTRRMMCICTTTNTAAPGSGGVAYVGSFSWNEDVPCWTFNRGIKACAETTSHEIGHTLFLRHHGVQGGGAYYGGHADWAAIMGNSMSRSVTHWSSGEYNNADNSGQDDLNLIVTRNGFGYKQDDHGNNQINSSDLFVDQDGTVSGFLNNSEENVVGNGGIIERNSDIDVFTISVASQGVIDLDINPHPNYANLNIRARLLNANENLVEESSPTNSLSASINATVNQGEYYLLIEGVGNGANPGVGYSDYNSMGVYTINGSVPPPSPIPIPVFSADVKKGCGGLEVNFTDLSSNNPDIWEWTFAGATPSNSNQQNPSVTYNEKGVYDVSLTVENEFGENTTTYNGYIEVLDPSEPFASDVYLCSEGEEVELRAQSLDAFDFNWYLNESDENPEFTGNRYLVNVNENNNYFVSAISETLVENVGHISPDVGEGDYHNGNFFLIFDASEPFTLQSAIIDAQGAGERTLELRNAQGDLILEKVINIPNGSNRVVLDVDIPAGNDLQIGFASTANIFRSSAGISYPYEIDGLVNIKTSSAGGGFGNDFYYYLYDWEVIGNKKCESEKIEITTNIEEVPTLDVNDVAFCESGTVNLSVSDVSAENVVWYSDAQGSEVAVEGKELTTTLTNDSTFYLSAISSPNSSRVGHLTPELGDGGTHQGGFYLIFDTEQPIVLKSALVQAFGTKARELVVRNANDQVIAQKTIMIEDGLSRIEIDLQIPQGEDLQIGFLAGADLFRSNSGVDFPYKASGLLNIKSSSANSDPSAFYYYLYDWEVEPQNGCFGEIVSFDAFIENLEAPIIEDELVCSAGDEATFNSTSSDDVVWFDDINSDSPIFEGATFTAIINSDTTFYAASASDSCLSEKVEVNAVIDVCTSTDLVNSVDQMKVYPNPFNNEVNLEIVYNNVQLIVYDNQGRVLDTKLFQKGIHIYYANELAPGFYMFELTHNQKNQVFKLIKR